MALYFDWINFNATRDDIMKLGKPHFTYLVCNI